MFDKRKGSAPPPEPAAGRSSAKTEPTTDPMNDPRAKFAAADGFNTRSAAMIGPTIKIKGDVTGEENLLIEGTVDGSVELSQHDLTIGQSGQVLANLNAKTVKIDGQVTGDIAGAEKVIVSASGRVQGNIIAPRVTLEDGAKFKGSIDMDPGSDKPSSVAPPKRANATKPELAEDESVKNTA